MKAQLNEFFFSSFLSSSHKHYAMGFALRLICNQPFLNCTKLRNFFFFEKNEKNSFKERCTVSHCKPLILHLNSYFIIETLENKIAYSLYVNKESVASRRELLATICSVEKSIFSCDN